jgi:hypothetical protein
MTAFHIFHTVGALLFSAFAFLQFNDASQYGNHDAWIWIALYSTAALISLCSLIYSVSLSALYLWLGFVGGSLLFRIQDDQGNLHLDWLDPNQYWNESGNQMVQQTNESGGLVILLIWALIQLLIAQKRKTKLPPYTL